MQIEDLVRIEPSPKLVQESLAIVKYYKEQCLFVVSLGEKLILSIKTHFRGCV